MRKLAWCAPLLLVLLAAPFAAAAFLATAQAPAAIELTAAHCAAPGAGVDAAAGAGPGAGAGDPWRAPFATWGEATSAPVPGVAACVLLAIIPPLLNPAAAGLPGGTAVLGARNKAGDRR